MEADAEGIIGAGRHEQSKYVTERKISAFRYNDSATMLKDIGNGEVGAVPF
jgi:hypothetical protein